MSDQNVLMDKDMDVLESELKEANERARDITREILRRRSEAKISEIVGVIRADESVLERLVKYTEKEFRLFLKYMPDGLQLVANKVDEDVAKQKQKSAQRSAKMRAKKSGDGDTGEDKNASESVTSDASKGAQTESESVTQGVKNGAQAGAKSESESVTQGASGGAKTESESVTRDDKKADIPSDDELKRMFQGDDTRYDSVSHRTY